MRKRTLLVQWEFFPGRVSIYDMEAAKGEPDAYTQQGASPGSTAGSL